MPEAQRPPTGEVQEPELKYNDVSPFDGLQEFLEDRDREESEIRNALVVAVKAYLNGEVDIDEDEKTDYILSELAAIALSCGFEPDYFIALYNEIQEDLDK